MSQAELFGDEVDEFRSALERYGVWPVTVWACDLTDPKTRRIKELIGDVDVASTRSVESAGQNRERKVEEGRLQRLGLSTRVGTFTKPTTDKSTYRGKVTASIFNPAVAAWLLNCFAPDEGTCFDPFAGGGTRAIMAAKHGLDYVGMELRLEEVHAVRERCASAGVEDRVTLLLGDAQECPGIQGAHFADFLLTCPPYYNLERYEGGERDLSMKPTYRAFLDGLGRVVAQCRRLLKPGATACWVVGLIRDDAGELIPFHHDVVRLHREAGFTLREEIILHQVNTGAIQRVGNFDKGRRHLIRVHEYALVFRAPA